VSHPGDQFAMDTVEVGQKWSEGMLFHFDKVFTSSATQLNIFEEVKPFVQAALDGDNVCIFAYGQTGSGKTFTMQGPEWMSFEAEEDNDMSGIIPRTGQFIFKEINWLNKQGWKFWLQASCFEIYCDELKDLLC